MGQLRSPNSRHKEAIQRPYAEPVCTVKVPRPEGRKSLQGYGSGLKDPSGQTSEATRIRGGEKGVEGLMAKLILEKPKKPVNTFGGK